MSVVLFLVLFLVGYGATGTITAGLWQRLTRPELASEDLYVIRILWWVFAPIGLALLLMYALNYLFKDLLPKSRRTDL